MASVRDYFDTDFLGHSMKLSTEYNITGTRADGALLSAELPFAAIWNFDANARWTTFFVPENVVDPKVCCHLIEKCAALYDQVWTGLQVLERPFGYEEVDSDNLKDTQQVYLYLDNDLSEADRKSVLEFGRSHSRLVRLRERKWAQMRSAEEKPVLFISHDTRDKDAVARPLAQALTKYQCPVWYDEFTLKLGDPLRENIERGLKQCEKCILVLSKNFFANGGWTKLEFETIIQRELIEEKLVIVPVWHGITKKDVYEYCPQLVNRLAAVWDETGDHAAIADNAAKKILDAIGRRYTDSTEAFRATDAKK